MCLNSLLFISVSPRLILGPSWMTPTRLYAWIVHPEIMGTVPQCGPPALPSTSIPPGRTALLQLACSGALAAEQAFQSSLPRATVCFGCAPAGQLCRRQQKRDVQTGCSKPPLMLDPVPGEKRPNPARFAPYWHPRELILPSVYPALPFPSLGKLLSFSPGSTALGTHGESRRHPCRDLGSQAAETAQHQGLPWLTAQQLPLQTQQMLTAKKQKPKQKNEASAEMHCWWTAAGYCWFCRGSCSCRDLCLLPFAASWSCLSSKKHTVITGSGPWGYYCTMGNAATAAAGRDAGEVIFLLCP